jgi:hypothetical protein
MIDAPPPPEFHLHFEGENALVRAHKVPATALIQAVQALQRVVHLLAVNYEGGEIKQRLRVSRQMERKYAVVCGVPQVYPKMEATIFPTALGIVRMACLMRKI